MPHREVISTFDAIVEDAQAAIRTTPEYVRQELEAHFERHPRDRGSTFVNNLFRKVEQERDTFMQKLAGTFSLMRDDYAAGRYDFGLWGRNIDVAVNTLGRMLQHVTPGTQRYDAIDRLRQEIVVLGRILKWPEATVPKGYESWKKVGEGIWQRDMPAFQLVVQESGGAYYATVKDIEKGRVYSDATAYPTLEQAMQKATTRAVHAASVQPPAAQAGYTMPSNGKQRRLF